MGHNVVQVACGQSSDHQVLALTDAGCIYSWVGAGQGGQVPKLIEALSGAQHIISIRFDEMLLINSGLDVSQVCAGFKCCAALTRGGDVYTWGHLGSEELGVTWPRHVPGVQAVQMSAGPGHIAVTDTRGRVWGWGDNDKVSCNSCLICDNITMSGSAGASALCPAEQPRSADQGGGHPDLHRPQLRARAHPGLELTD